MPLIDWKKRHDNAFENRRILVTGGAGFIGSHLVDALLSLGAEVSVIDDLSGGDANNILPPPPHTPHLTADLTSSSDKATRSGLTFHEGSIRDADTLALAIKGCDAVCHLAALGSVPGSVAEPVRYHDINVTGTMDVVEAARAAGVRRVVFSASAAAYGGEPTLPKTETMAPHPRSPYAAQKLACEHILTAYAACPEFAIDTVSLRYFNVFGPRQNANSAYAAVISAFAKALLQLGQAPVIYGDGEQSRDFIHVDNIVHANLLALRHDAPIGGGVFNVAIGQRISVKQLAETMAKLAERPDLTPDYHPERSGDIKHSVASIDAIQKTLNFEPVVDFAQGLAETVAWYRTTAQPRSPSASTPAS